MKSAIIMNNVSKINLVNRYQKGMIFLIGVIFIGGIAYYYMHRQYQKLNQRMTDFERSQNQMAEMIASNTTSIHTISLGVNQMLTEYGNFFNSLSALEQLLKPTKATE